MSQEELSGTDCGHIDAAKSLFDSGHLFFPDTLSSALSRWRQLPLRRWFRAVYQELHQCHDMGPARIDSWR